MRAVVIAALCAIAAPAMAQEKLSLSNVDARTTLTFKAPEAAVQKMLPEGWEVNSPTAGPAQGFNLGMTLIDQKYTQDAEGNPTAPVRGVVLNIPAKKKGSDVGGTMVVAGLFSPNGVPDAYGVYSPARVLIERRTRVRLNGDTISNESWEIRTEDGSAIEVQVRFTPAIPTKGKVEAKVYSGAKPDFYRIYRIEQAVDVARSVPSNIDRVTKVSINISGRKFAPLFDGTEKLISVTSIPWYSRQVYLP